MRASARAGRYEIRNATMVDLIRTAYTVDAENVLAGPSWLEYDRFDIAALMPPNTTPDTQKLMLRALLADRFKLAVRRDTKPAAGLVLVMGKGKHKLKEVADSAAAPGCQTQTVPARPPSGVPGQLVLPMTGLACRNVTMDTFAADLKRLTNGYVTNAVLDQTGLKGSWDFELQFTQRALLGLAASVDGATATSLSDAIDRQLGLKLEERDIPTPVLIVEQVNATPTANVADIAAKLPPPPPMEFEVADIKPVDPNARLTGPVQVGVSPGGRVNLPGQFFSLRTLVGLAWNLPTNVNTQIVGAPKWMDTAGFDIIAKLPSDLAPANGTTVPLQELGPALQALLIDRFKMKVHFEDRSVDAYTLVAVRPKLRRADPSTRTGCKAPANTSVVFNVSRGVPRAFTCQNMTMAQFADQLQTIAASYIAYPVVDATGLDGAWDFTLSFSPIDPQRLSGLMAGARGGALPAGGAGPADITASDPIGGGASVFDAVEKQLGLKLEVRKRTLPVFVIDHIEEKPADN
ncbi:MAG TPA: TIGR03435 family protein [Vicinamibacterales bacterium]|nr:TIGR03435 family protein [Vicinamibacterales bacterium]